MTHCTQALPQSAARSVSIDTLPLAPEALGLRPGPRAAATGARAIWWQLRSLRPPAAAAVAIAALTPLLGALWLGGRSPEAVRDDARLRLTAPNELPAIPRPSDADHALRLRRERLRPAAPPEGFYGAAGRGGPLEYAPEPAAAPGGSDPGPGGLMVPPPEPAWKPEGKLQPVAFTGAAGTGGAAAPAPQAAVRANRAPAAAAPARVTRRRLRLFRSRTIVRGNGAGGNGVIRPVGGFASEAPTAGPALAETKAGEIAFDPNHAFALMGGKGPHQEPGAKNYDGWPAGEQKTTITYKQGLRPRQD